MPKDHTEDIILYSITICGDFLMYYKIGISFHTGQNLQFADHW